MMIKYGKVLIFGKYKGKSIEEIVFIDCGWLRWAMQEPNLVWIKNYLTGLPKIYPGKVKMRCWGYHGDSSIPPIATHVVLPRDYKGQIVAIPKNAHYRCVECARTFIGISGKVILPLTFRSVLEVERRGDKRGFQQILKRAYGITRLTPKVAYEVFWE